MKLWFHGLELDIHRTPDLSRAPDGAGMFEIRSAVMDDRDEWYEYIADYESANPTIAYLNKHHRSAIEAACEAEARL